MRLCDEVVVVDWRWTSEVCCQVVYFSWDVIGLFVCRSWMDVHYVLLAQRDGILTI